MARVPKMPKLTKELIKMLLKRGEKGKLAPRRGGNKAQGVRGTHGHNSDAQGKERGKRARYIRSLKDKKPPVRQGPKRRRR